MLADQMLKVSANDGVEVRARGQLITDSNDVDDHEEYRVKERYNLTPLLLIVLNGTKYLLLPKFK